MSHAGPCLSEIRWPCHEAVHAKALAYAEASEAYTLLYAGWDAERRQRRILTGRYGQEWLLAFCAANGLPCVADDTDEKTEDKFDLMVGGHTVDVKTSCHPTLWPQVGAHLKGKSEFYAFLRCSDTFSWVQFQGFLPSEGVFTPAHFVAHGQPLPSAAGVIQRYRDGSYLLPESRLLNAPCFLRTFRSAEPRTGGLASAVLAAGTAAASLTEDDVAYFARKAHLFAPLAAMQQPPRRHK